MKKTIEERLWAKIDRRAPDACWIWHGATFPGGYGGLQVMGRFTRAHRLVYELCVGPIPPSYVVCHSCDHPGCCNPAHLWVGTVAQNNHDMANKGRAACGLQNAHGKLSDLDVAGLRAKYAEGKANQYQLAEEYGVSQATIWEAIHGKTHKHRSVK